MERGKGKQIKSDPVEETEQVEEIKEVKPKKASLVNKKKNTLKDKLTFKTATLSVDELTKGKRYEITKIQELKKQFNHPTLLVELLGDEDIPEGSRVFVSPR